MKIIQQISNVSVVAGTTARFWIGQVWDQGSDDVITIENLQVVDEDYVLEDYDLELINHSLGNAGDQYWDIYLTVTAKSKNVGETQLMCWINDGQDPETIQYKYSPLLINISVENFIPVVYPDNTTRLSNKNTLQHTVDAGTLEGESTGTFTYTITEVEKDDPGNAVESVSLYVENPNTTDSQQIKADVLLTANGAGLATIYYTIDNQHQVYSHDPPDIYSFKIMSTNYWPTVNVPQRTYVVCGDEPQSWTIGTITNYDSNADYIIDKVRFKKKPWFSYRLYLSGADIKLNLTCSKEYTGRTTLYFTVEDRRDNYLNTTEPPEQQIYIKCGNTPPTVDMPRKAIALKKDTSWAGYIGKISDVDGDNNFLIDTLKTNKPKNVVIETLEVYGNQIYLEVTATELGSEDIVFTIRDKYDIYTPSTVYDRGEPLEYTFTVKVV